MKKTKTAAVKEKPAKRKRQGNVRGLMLELLAAGPMSTTALVAKGGFSSAAAFLNLKALRDAGQIVANRNGREMLYALAGGSTDATAAPAIAPAAKRGRKPKASKAKAVGKAVNSAKAVLAFVPATLHEALSGLTLRLAPIEALEHKLHTLDQLVAALPAPVSTVLASIRADLQRMVAAPGHRGTDPRFQELRGSRHRRRRDTLSIAVPPEE